jgi:hypothetical protein
MASRVPSRAVTVRLKPEAYEIYRDYCPKGPKLGGAFFSRLLFEHAVREEERSRLKRRLFEKDQENEKVYG